MRAKNAAPARGEADGFPHAITDLPIYIDKNGVGASNIAGNFFLGNRRSWSAAAIRDICRGLKTQQSRLYCLDFKKAGIYCVGKTARMAVKAIPSPSYQKVVS
jgi:hypothetical protein